MFVDEGRLRGATGGTRILLARHGQTLWNLQGRVQGRRDSPLTELGLIQAEALAEAWAGEAVTRLVCSPAGRAKATAQVLETRLNCALSEDERLVEQDFGDFEGRLRTELGREYGELDRYFRGAEYGDGLAPPGGESFLQAALRMNSAIRAIAREGATVGIVSHGNAIQALLWLLTGTTGDSGVFRHSNASFSELWHRAGTLEPVRVGVVDHLPVTA